MFQALSNGVVSLWNLVPGAVRVANDALHAVYEPLHQTLHTLADLLTITLK